MTIQDRQFGETRKRTPFARWMWERGLAPKDLTAPLRRSYEAIRTYALDFDDPKRVVPDPETMKRISALTGGMITPAHFYEPPEVKAVEPSGPAADEDWTGRDFLNIADAP